MELAYEDDFSKWKRYFPTNGLIAREVGKGRRKVWILLFFFFSTLVSRILTKIFLLKKLLKIKKKKRIEEKISFPIWFYSSVYSSDTPRFDRRLKISFYYFWWATRFFFNAADTVNIMFQFQITVFLSFSLSNNLNDNV